eukprot:CAMPEP_0201738856 /NCGR_PEP_ID=MMETSP0593-20130828/45472_1 /ASSEMBLY_ACC=CAM_ASM_000672 /TAXON_ID=267983 /ORGANISM="Skeletonema japonicum, Strain CCMP2506" /LENGTH=303 /DNA_ID=CAMNT_0048233087 /DNA_START=19 /DNA_END=930 /DNA_ORIENTATION=+
MAAEGGDIVRFTYTGEEGEVIPRDATHVFVDVTTIPARAFWEHPAVVEVICHDKVEKIEVGAFYGCPSLKRLIMPGVKIVEEGAFHGCKALTDVECGKLKIIGGWAFTYCRSLRSINLPSAEIVDNNAFFHCKALTNAKFGKRLERMGWLAFKNCPTLERITIPLKDGMITADDIFMGCESLNHVDLVEGAELRETIAALHLEEWRKDMREEINSINQILPNARGEKAQAIQRWIKSLIRKIIRFKEEHQGLLNEAATTLELVLPQDMVMNNILPFLGLPPHTFGEDYESEEEEEDDSEDEEM